MASTSKEQALRLKLQQIKTPKSGNLLLVLFFTALAWATMITFCIKYPNSVWYIGFAILGFISFIILAATRNIGRDRKKEYVRTFSTTAIQGILDEWALGLHYKVQDNDIWPTLIENSDSTECLHFFDAPLHRFRLSAVQQYQDIKNNEGDTLEAKGFKGWLWQWRFPERIFKQKLILLPNKSQKQLEAMFFNSEIYLKQSLNVEPNPSYCLTYASEDYLPFLRQIPAKFWEDWSAEIANYFPPATTPLAFMFYERDAWAVLPTNDLLQPIWAGNRIDIDKTLAHFKQYLYSLLHLGITIGRHLENAPWVQKS